MMYRALRLLTLLAALVALPSCTASLNVDASPSREASSASVVNDRVETPSVNPSVALKKPAKHVSGEIDYRCETDADCAVKDVGNCCGYYPACVNKDSPTFPEQVKAACAESGLMGVCGFPSIAGCQCIEGRCESQNAVVSPIAIDEK